MKCDKNESILNKRTVWVISFSNMFTEDKSLLLSKVSEAIMPNEINNHIGAGSTMDDFLKKQKGVRFIINGGFNHYRKNFYEWEHQSFNVGDPVGLVKIRNHYFEDFVSIENYGFFIQKEKSSPWSIVQFEQLTKKEKYILGCTPLLIFNGERKKLPIKSMEPVPVGKVNPPSILGHGLECHPRTAVGLKDGNVFFVLVEGGGELDGCSLLELQDIGMKLGLESFLNLDGGGSSQFRLKQGNDWIKNKVEEKDKNRILGNVIVLFDEALKK